MRRDMDLMRELVLKLEALPMRPGGIAHIPSDASEIAVPGFSPAEIDYHLQQIVAAGWIDTGGSRPIAGLPFRSLTPSGHDFADSVRDPKTWAATKDGALKAGGWTLSLLGDLAKGFIKQQVRQRTGIDV